MSQKDIEALFGAPTTAPPEAPAAAGSDIGSIFPEGSVEEPKTVAGTAMQPIHGFNEALPGAIGWPVDLANFAMRKVGLPVSEKPVMGSEWIASRLRDVGVHPEQYPASGLAERALRAGGEGAAYALVPQAALEATAGKVAGQAAKIPEGITARETLEKVFGARKPGSLAATLENAGVNLGAGMGAEAAAEQVPERWKSIAGMAGGLGGGLLTHLGVEGVKTFPKMGKAAFEYMEPTFNPEMAAARKFTEKTKSPMYALDVIENEPHELVPGSKPTTFELTGDLGQGRLQRETETKNPIPFIQRKGEQAGARQEALSTVTGEGDVLQVPQVLREQLAAVEAQENSVAQRAQERVRDALDQMGGQQNPEDYGRLLRQYMQEEKNKARDARKALYDAIDPKGQLNVVSQGVRDTAQKVAEEAAAPLAEPLDKKHADIIQAASGLDDVIPFKNLRTLDTRISDAMRTELQTNGESNAYRLLSQLKQGTLDAINNAVENQAKYETDAVRLGKMSDADTLEARMRGLWGITGNKPPAKAGEPLVPNLTPEDIANTEAAKQAHKEYVGTFREGSVGDVLQLTKGAGQYKLDFDSKVGPRFFRAGDAGYEAAQQFLRAAGDNQKAVDTMKDYIVSRAFNETRDPATGLIDPKKFENWKRTHKDALRAFPDIADDLSTASRASNSANEIAARSRATIEAAQGTEIAKIVGAKDAETVTQMVGEIFAKKNAPTVMRALSQAASASPDAQQGLQRAVADYIAKRFVSVAEVGTSEEKAMNSAAFQKFVRDNRKTLQQVFDEKQVNSMQALADDLNRGARSTTGNVLTGRSGTAQDVSGTIEKGKSYWDSLTKGVGALTAPIIGGGAMGSVAGPITGLGTFGAIVGAEVLASMRAAGMKNVDQIITDALLDPNLAAQLLRKVPPKPGPSSTRSLSEAIANTSIIGAKQPIQQEDIPPLTIHGPREGRATGGAVNLMALSKAAKKRVTQVTEPLLNQSDDDVAHALEVAGKHI